MVRKRYIQNRVNYLLTEVVQSDKYYKSHAVGVTSEVGLLLTDLSDLSVFASPCLRDMASLILL